MRRQLILFRDINQTGDFIWYELLCNDADAAARFYGKVIGWQVEDSGQKDIDYRILRMPDIDTGEPNGVGGLLQLDADMRAGGARPVDGRCGRPR